MCIVMHAAKRARQDWVATRMMDVRLLVIAIVMHGREVRGDGEDASFWNLVAMATALHIMATGTHCGYCTRNCVDRAVRTWPMALVAGLLCLASPSLAW